MQHHMDVGAAVADIDNSVARNAESDAEIVDGGNFAVSSGNLNDIVDIASHVIEFESGCDDVIRRDDAIESGVDDLPRRRGHDVEVEFKSLYAVSQKVGEKCDVS